MDAALIAVAIAGGAVGVVASALPGIHVNLLAVALLALGAGDWGAPFLVAALAASPFGLALSSVFAGGASDDAALSSLPANALAKDGRLREAVALQCWGALFGILLALPLALLVRAVLVPAAPWLALATPVLLLLVVALLIASEPRRIPLRPELLEYPWGRHFAWHDDRLSGVAGKLAALAVLLLSGLVGLAAFRLGAASPFGFPSSPLLPLLAGLFALPTLLTSAAAPAARMRALLRPPRTRARSLARDAWPGAAVAVTLGLLPGVSASHAGLLTPRADGPERALARLAALNGAAVVFTLLAWHALGRARAGALVAAGELAPVAPWGTWAPSPEILREAALVLLAAVVGFALARAVAAPLARLAARPLAIGGLVLVLASAAAFNGAMGLAVLAGAALVGALPMRWGVRRSHAMGAILVPVLLRAWGLA